MRAQAVGQLSGSTGRIACIRTATHKHWVGSGKGAHLVVLTLGSGEDQGIAVDILHTFTLGHGRLGCRGVGRGLLRRLDLCTLEAVEGRHAALMQVDVPMCGGW